MEAAKYYRRVCEQLDCRIAVGYLNALRTGSKSCTVDGQSTGYNGMGQDVSLYAIASTLSQSGLSEIGIDKMTVGVDILWAFINAVARSRSVDTLRITGCIIEEKGQERNLGDIGAALGQLHIHTLDLTGTALASNLFQQFVGGTALFKLLRHKGLRELRLTRCELQDEHVEMMINALINMMGSAGLSFSMRKLVLGHNNITDHGCMVLARLLEGEGALSAARLQLLDLQHNEITNLGAEVLFKACEKAKALAHINMTGNYLGDASTRALCNAWRVNPGVASQVLLGYSKAPRQWTQEGLLSLLQAATRADHLVVFDIRGLKLKETLALHSVCRLILKATKLEVLRVDVNSPQDIFELWAAIRANRSLIQVWVGCEILNESHASYASAHHVEMHDHLQQNYAKKRAEKEGVEGANPEAERPDELKAELAIFDYVAGGPLPLPARKSVTPPASVTSDLLNSSSSVNSLPGGNLRIKTHRGPSTSDSPPMGSTPSSNVTGSKLNIPTMHWMSHGDSPAPVSANGWNTPDSSQNLDDASSQHSSSYAPPSLSGSFSPSSSQPTSLFSDDKLVAEAGDDAVNTALDLRSLTGYGTKYQYAGHGSRDGGRSVAPSVSGRSRAQKPTWGAGSGAGRSRSGSRAGSIMGDRRPPPAQPETKMLNTAIAFRKYDTNRDLLLTGYEMVMALADTGVLVGTPPIKLSEYLMQHQSSQVAEDEMYSMTDFMNSHDLVLKFKSMLQAGTISVSVPIGAGTNKPLKRVFKAYCMAGGLNVDDDGPNRKMPLMLMVPLQFRAMCADAGFLHPLGSMNMMAVDIVFGQCKDREKRPGLSWINFLKALVVLSQETAKSFDQVAAALTSMPLPTMETSGTFTPVRFVALHEMDSLRNISAKVAARERRAGVKQRRSSACSYTSDSSYTSSTASILQTIA